MDPHLVLERIAARRVVLVEGRQPAIREPCARLADLLGAVNLDATASTFSLVNTGEVIIDNPAAGLPGMMTPPAGAS